MVEQGTSLAELRKKESKKGKFVPWLRKVWPALFNWKSLLWFGIFIFVLGIFWMFYSFFFNSGTQMFAWGDYTDQYCNFCYGYWDVWHNFFKTGVFELYSSATFFGTDNIGSNAYYGLFDPFCFICCLLPRSMIPQSMALVTCLKGVVGAFGCRAYLKYMGLSEKASRIGGVAFAFNGYLNFMAGFPSTVSAVAVTPLIFLGIEKVIKERKPTILMFSLALLGMISFFFLVVFCIFGVLYALWRYFWTIRKRNLKENLLTILFGVGSFALGIMLCAWVLLPSLRESTLSPRVSSIGSAYLATLKTALAGKNFSEAFHLIFEIVGENPGRELQGIVSFLYPTCGFKFLPLYSNNGYNYDSWTASLFVYTPLAILFFGALITSFRKHRWDHILAFLICVTMVFTIFPYYFFYAFAGDGYGRWYIVLIPIIIYYACSEFDELATEPKWQLPTASLIELALTVATWLIVVKVLKDKSFYSPNKLTYYFDSYKEIPAEDNGVSLQFVIYYQIALVVIESLVMSYFRNKEYFYKIIIGFIAVETIVCGNLAFATSGITTYDSYNGGPDTVAAQRSALAQLDEVDGDEYYRIYNDSETSANTSNAIGYNGSRTFNSLYNYGLSDFLRQSHIMGTETYYKTYGGNKAVHSTWSGQYVQKRHNFDMVAGFNYYMIKNDGYSTWNDDEAFATNVPFGSECVVKTDQYRIYTSGYSIDLGFGVDKVYRLGDTTTVSAYSPNYTSYFQNGGFGEIKENEETYLDAAIVDDAAEVPESIAVSPSGKSLSGLTTVYLADPQVNTTIDGYGFNAPDPGSFLTDSSKIDSSYGGWRSISYGGSYNGDDDKVVIAQQGGGYMNDDPNGGYFEMSYAEGGSDLTENGTRIYLIGDTFEEDGVTVKKSNACLSFEYHALQNTIHGEQGGSSSYNGLYGFYARGRVKYVVFCGRSKGQRTYMPSSFSLQYKNKSALDSRYASLTDKEHAVTDVTYSTDRFTCKTDFSTSKFVTTHIGYDAGWKVSATKEDGTTEKLTTYRLDGGLVGFIAPSGATSYVLEYETPYLRTGLALSTAALLVYFGYEIGLFIYNVKRTQKEMGIDYWCRPTNGKKKKDDEAKDDVTSSKLNL